VDLSAARALLDQTDRLLEGMIVQQRNKVLRLAQEAVPHLGQDDLLNPHDHPALKAHPTFEYEDGLLAGLLSAQMAIRAELKQRLGPA
jgi:hypothetical protein